MKKQNLSSKLTLSKRVISNLQSEAVKGRGSWICPTTNGGNSCSQAPSQNVSCQHQ